MSAYKRLKSFAHWVKLEQNPSEDRSMHAEDIGKLLAVVDAASQVTYGHMRDDCEYFSVPNHDMQNLKSAIKELGENWVRSE